MQHVTYLSLPPPSPNGTTIGLIWFVIVVVVVVVVVVLFILIFFFSKVYVFFPFSLLSPFPNHPVMARTLARWLPKFF